MKAYRKLQLFEQLLDGADNLAGELVEHDRTIGEREKLAMSLHSFVRSIIKLSETDGVENSRVNAERIESIASKAFEAFPEMIALGNGYSLCDVHARLWVAQNILELLESLVASPLLSIGALDRFGDKLHEQLEPALNLAVRLMNPQTFEFGYVPDAWVQSGYRAMSVASKLSRIITHADAKAHRTGGMENIAA